MQLNWDTLNDKIYKLLDDMNINSEVFSSYEEHYNMYTHKLTKTRVHFFSDNIEQTHKYLLYKLKKSINLEYFDNNISLHQVYLLCNSIFQTDVTLYRDKFKNVYEHELVNTGLQICGLNNEEKYYFFD